MIMSEQIYIRNIRRLNMLISIPFLIVECLNNDYKLILHKFKMDWL